MSKKTTHQIREIAKTILRDKGQGSRFPVSLLALANNEFLEIEPLDTASHFEGRLELLQNKPTILLNTHHGGYENPRGRFTLGHELGHFFLHRRFLRRGQTFHDSEFFAGTELGDVEREANQFASECLLPEPLVSRFLGGKYLCISGVQELAQLAKTSLPATAIRLASLTGSRSCFFWEGDGRIKWSAPSDDWRHAMYPCTAWRGRVPEGSHMAAESGSYEEREVSRSTWHPKAWDRDGPLYESALSTQSGRLVLLVDSSSDVLVED